MPALPRTIRKSTENRSASASRTSRATDRLRKPLFSSSEASKWCPEGSLGRLWALLSGSWGALGRSCGALGRSWSALGPLLGVLGRAWDALGALLGRSWGALGRSWLPRDDLGSIFDPPGVDFETSGCGFSIVRGSLWQRQRRRRGRR